MKFSTRKFGIAAGLVIVAGAGVAGAGINMSSRAAVSAHADAEMADADAGLHLVLNVAGNRLHVYEDGERTKSYAVSVGKRGYETPGGNYTIREVIWNPWWHPPNSAWARGRKPEAPGPDNPMGRVKLNFAPLLYIHGTSDWQALGEPASHGCVRMRNTDLIELTRIVHKHASPRVEEDVLARLEDSPSMTRTIRLQRPVKFTAQYDVAIVDNGFLVIYPDHYGLVKQQVREQAVKALEENGVDIRRVDQRQLDELVRTSSTRRVVVALDELTSRNSRVGDETAVNNQAPR